MGSAESKSEIPKVGYHVLQVQPGGPGEAAGLHSFFDFIVAVNGSPCEREDSKFVETLKSNVGKEVRLVVFNSRAESTRETSIIPSETWGGSGLAGISIRFCNFERIHELVWHVLDVYPNSPASAAGLQAHADYIVGTPELVFNESDDFFNLINSNDGRSIPLYVFNAPSDRIRLVSITPNRHWGGSGCLGCDVGFGFLHRIPTYRLPPPASTLTPPESPAKAAMAPPHAAPAQHAYHPTPSAVQHHAPPPQPPVSTPPVPRAETPTYAPHAAAAAAAPSATMAPPHTASPPLSHAAAEPVSAPAVSSTPPPQAPGSPVAPKPASTAPASPLQPPPQPGQPSPWSSYQPYSIPPYQSQFQHPIMPGGQYGAPPSPYTSFQPLSAPLPAPTFGTSSLGGSSSAAPSASSSAAAPAASSAPAAPTSSAPAVSAVPSIPAYTPYTPYQSSYTPTYFSSTLSSLPGSATPAVPASPGGVTIPAYRPYVPTAFPVTAASPGVPAIQRSASQDKSEKHD